MKSFWTKIKQKMKQDMPEHTYKLWIEPVHFLESENNHIKLISPNQFYVKRLKDNYLTIFEKEFSKLCKDDIRIELTIDVDKNNGRNNIIENKKGSYAAAQLNMNCKEVQQLGLPGLDVRFNSGRMFKKGFTFDDFVVGKNSNFAYSASLSLAQGSFGNNNILFLLSKTGLGKSHLSQAAGHHIITKGISDSVYYITAEDFTNEMIYSIRSNTISKFKEKYRTKCDVLILEDVHFLSGKDATQKELAITLDYLLDADRKIIFSGCYLPDEMPKMNEQLRSRLNLGLVTKIDAPDYSTRVRILKKKSKDQGYDIPMDVTQYLAQELCDDVRQLESGLNGVAAKGNLLNRNIDIELAQSVLRHFNKRKKMITVDFIKKLVCKEFSLSLKEIISSSRKQRVVKPRQIAIFLSRKYTDQPLQAIGKSFNKYHATTIYSINAIEKEIKRKGQLFEQVQYLCKKIEDGKF